MSSKTSLAISYWAYPLGEGKMEELAGIEEFESKLSENFSVFISGKSTDALGGGLYEMVMTILHNERVQDALLYAGGIVTDSVVDIAKDKVKDFLVTYIGKPIKDAFSKISEQNKEKEPDIDRIEIQFKDMCIFIYNVCPDGIAKNLEIILDLFEKRFAEFLSAGQLPDYVYIPLFRDDKAPTQSWKNLPVFRKLESIDETIQGVTDAAYLDYWGLFYTFQEDQCRVYNVRTKEIFNADITSLESGSLK
jgi:hypothetical protein